MGFAFSKLSCANNNKNCNFNSPVSYSDFLLNNKDLLLVPNQKIRDEQYHKRICNDFNGNVLNCCDKNDTEILNTDQALPIKINNNLDGSINNIQICKCSGNSYQMTECMNKNCQGFKQPTKYEMCKITNPNKSFDMIFEEDQPLWTLKSNDLTPDCFQKNCDNIPEEECINRQHYSFNQINNENHNENENENETETENENETETENENETETENEQEYFPYNEEEILVINPPEQNLFIKMSSSSISLIICILFFIFIIFVIVMFVRKNEIINLY